jgi:ketol-acid reductoisomerase
MTRPRKAKSVAVIGYGSQGRAITQNLRDSGFDVVVGLRPKSGSRRRARADRVTVKSIPAAVEQADIICLAFPDHLHARVFKHSIEPSLRRHATLWFLHATSVHFKLLVPPSHCDVILVAPHAPGLAVRDEYLSKRSLSAFYGVARNRSGQAARTAIALATGIGVRRKNLIKTSFAQEAVGDLFGEQAVLCGGLAMLIKSGFETLLSHGWKPENAWLEVAFQLDLIVTLIKNHGLVGMLERISPAARYGSLLAGPKIIDPSLRSRMEHLFREIESGTFARKLARLDEQALVRLQKELNKLSHPALERAARKFSR